jgi:hypothetical protein
MTQFGRLHCNYTTDHMEVGFCIRKTCHDYALKLFKLRLYGGTWRTHTDGMGRGIENEASQSSVNREGWLFPKLP